MAWRAPSASAFRERLALERRSATPDGIPGYLADYKDTALEAVLAAILGVEDEPIEEEDDPGNSTAPISADLSNGATSTDLAEQPE